MTVAAASADELFLPVGPAAEQGQDAVAAASAAVASENLGPTLRYRLARIDSGLLSQARESARLGASPAGLIDLNLFEDASFQVADLRTAPTSVGYSLSGELLGEPASGMTLVVNGDLIAGEVRLPGATFTIRSIGDIVEIREADEDALPECAELEGPPTATARAAPAAVGSPAVDPPAMDLPAMDLQASAEITEIDVLVAYTTAARDHAGGEAAMETRIDLWVAAANTYFENSGVHQRIRLAHSEELDYVETSSSYEFGRLVSPDDGFMDSVHAMRDAVGADIVHLIERWGAWGTSRYCGIAYVMASVGGYFRDFAFGATALDCGSLTFAHELGHNMGLRHDRYADATSFSLTNLPYAYSYGYVNQAAFASDAAPSQRWRTIMAYSRQCSHSGVGCSRIGRFSNPAQTYSGDPAGVWRNGNVDAVTGPADAALTLNQTRATVAAFLAPGSDPVVVSLKRRAPAEESTNGGGLTWRLAFSQDVKGVTSDDFELSGSDLGITTLTVAAKTGSQRIYDVAVTSGLDSFDGEVALAFSSGQDIESLSDVALVAAWPADAELAYTLDNTSPAPSISPAGAGSSPFVATISFNEDVSGFSDAADVTATNATVTAPSRSNARTYTVQVTPTGTTAATITLSVPASAATDLVGNASTAASQDVAWDPSTGTSLTVSGYSDGSVAENSQWTSATPAVGGSPSGAVSWTKEGADADLFTINASTGVLGLPGQNYEEPADAGANGQYEVVARATDAKGDTATAAVAVTVTDAVETKTVGVGGASSRKIPDDFGYSSPVFLQCNSACQAAGGAVKPVTWTRTGADEALFTQDSETGALSLGVRDFETPEDADGDNEYLVTVRGTDADGNTDSRGVTVQVFKAPPQWLAVSDVSSGIVEENDPWTSATPTVTGADGSVTWTKEGADADQFSVATSGVLTLPGQDHDNPADADEDNVYEVLLRATDAEGNSGTAPVSVTVTAALRTLSVEDARAAEGAGKLDFRVTLSGSTSSVVTVDYLTSDGAGSAGARAGADYTAASGTLTFPADDASAREIGVILLDDTADEEEEETFFLTLQNPVNASLDGGVETLQAIGTIVDDDDPEVEVSFGRSSYDVTEGQTVTVQVRLNRVPERALRIGLKETRHGGASEADYSGVPSTVTFGPGQTSQGFGVRATDDTLDDDGESVVLTFASLPSRVSGDGATTVAIHDNDGDDDGGGPPPGGGLPPDDDDDDDDGGGPPPDDDDDDDNDDGGGTGGGGPPRAAISTDAECGDAFCRARTGQRVSFRDASTGAVRSRRWDFGDGRQPRSASVNHAWSAPGFYEVTLWTSDGEVESTASLVFLVEASDPAGACVADGQTRCLQDSRYAVTVDWRSPNGEGGGANVVRQGTNDSALFWFFDPGNWEVLIKVLDGCAYNGHVWVFGASTTDRGYLIRVTDTVTDTVKEYRNEPGQPAPALTDVTAFPQGCSRP